LDELALLLDQIAQGNLTPDDRKRAETIENFFSTTARNHHAMEEEMVFPALLTSDNSETVAKVRDLIEDHFWIEKYWLDLAPVLKAIGNSSGEIAFDKLSRTVKLFHDLCSYHIECEESMIYPQAKAAMNAMQAQNGIN
jgi:hemerythrin-like domain-containing protein